LQSNFLWGASTSSYQVEGGISNNDWDFFARNEKIKKRISKITTPILGGIIAAGVYKALHKDTDLPE